ncbi:MAG: site-specific integrase [Endomicrobiales bacterium]|nr:site-specific integrase [Endomicrobiales bacterium]
MGYMYKNGDNWRLVIYKDRKRKNINLGQDFNKAKIIKASIEQVAENDKFKQNLVQTLIELGFLDKNLRSAPSDEKCVTWDYAKQKLLDHLEKMGRAKRTLYTYNLAFRSIENIIKPEKPSDVSIEKADNWIETLMNVAKSAAPTQKKVLRAPGASVLVRTVKAAFQKFARWQYVDKNPFTKCDMPKVETPIPRPLSPEELDLILKASNKPLKRAIKILVYSGMRPDEYFNLPWRRVKLGKNPYIHITVDGNWHPKAYTQRMIPVTTELLDAMGKPGNQDELVAGKNEVGFPINGNWLRRSFKRAVVRAGLTDKKITAYCCRDTYATNLALQGYEAHAIAARLGHRDISTSMKYVSLARINMADVKLNKKNESVG